MPVPNAEIADRLDRLADLLDIEAANPFRVRAYRRAGRLVRELPREVTEMLASGEPLDALPGIGTDLAATIAALAHGEMPPRLAEAEQALPAGVVALLTLPGLGPKRVRVLHEALGIDSREALAAAVRAGRLRGVPGFGSVMERKLLAALAAGPALPGRVRLADVETLAASLLAWLRASPGVERAELAGSFRRRCATVGDLDLVAAARAPAPVMERFVAFESVSRVLLRGPTRASVVLRDGLQVDLRVVADVSFGAALCYFTGAKPHSIALRRIAQAQGCKLNEYGLFRDRRRLAGRTEADLYRTLGLPLIPPELREGTGEIAAARAGRLPLLLTRADLRGDLHVHTVANDGPASLADMVRAARRQGHAYVAIADHCGRVGAAGRLDPTGLGRQMDAIARLNATLDDLTVLAGCEVDILEDGSLDLPDDVLHRLDLVVAAVNTNFDLPSDRQTERILRAMDHRDVTILAHPSGRRIGRRPAYGLDLERVMRGALERGCFLEVNAQPDRLDLDDSHCRLAKAMGLKIAISSDADAPAELAFLRFGVDQARRGWLAADDVLNTKPLAELRALLRRP